MKRRGFIQSIGISTIPILLQGTPISVLGQSRLFSAIDFDSDRVLVLVQLLGGNDGLNTIMPLDQYDVMAKIREGILVPEAKLLQVNDTNAFHPSMGGMQLLYEQGYLGAIQSVGYPDQNRSHFRSKDIWTSASASNELVSEGWVGRVFYDQHPQFPEGFPNEQFSDPLAVTIGQIVSETCQGPGANFSYTLNNPDELGQLDNPLGSEIDDSCYGQELSFIRTAIEQSNAYAGIVSEAYEKGINSVDYSQNGADINGLYRQLQIVAKLISGGSKTKVFVVSMGGFDTHADQVVEGETDSGEHAELLKELSEAMSLFQEDLVNQGLEERVLGMTFSEFGRRIRSNGSIGTDHGTAAPMFLFGSCVQSRILGHNPELDENVGTTDGVPMQYDFRSVYGTVLTDWMGVDEAIVRSLIFEDFKRLPILEACKYTVKTEEESKLFDELNISPNPATDWITFTFIVRSGRVEVDIFDAEGKRVLDRITKNLVKGKRSISFEIRDLQPGIYYALVVDGVVPANKSFIKI